MPISYLNDPKLKKDLVKQMEKHRESDALIKGTYETRNGKFRGCAVGCAVESLRIKRGVNIKNDDHASYAEAIGIPEWLVRLEDTLFESLPDPEYKAFPVKFLQAIPVGVNLEPVKWKFCAYLLKENIERVLSLENIDDTLREKVVDSIRAVLSVHESAVISGKWDESAAESAMSAAESAAVSAARSAAWSAAESAARSAAESAAWSAAESAMSAADSAAWSAAMSAAWSAAESAAVSAAESAARSAAESAMSAAYVRHENELLRLLRKEQEKKG